MKKQIKKAKSGKNNFQKTLVRLISIVLIIVLILNMVFLALGKIKDVLFWIILLLAGISSFVIRKVLQ